MQFTRALLLLVALTARPVSGTMLRSKPPPEQHPNATAAVAKAATVADVAKLHKKLEGVALGLSNLLSSEKTGSLSTSQIAPMFRSFLKELRTTLAETAAPKDPSAAMTRLRNAQSGVSGLTKELGKQQEALMRQDATEETNLLLGVLMTRRGEPMKKQLEVLASADFRSLPVSQALLAKHDEKSPLFQQVALYVDQHGTPASNMTHADQKKMQLQKTLGYFQHRVDLLKGQEETLKRIHDRRDSEFDTQIKGSKDKTNAHHLELMKRHADRDFKKRMLTQKQQTKMMTDVVEALKKGDMAALQKAQDALKAQMEAMQRNSGDFLHFLQIGHRLESQDCPFCVAQCIGKCHDGGNPYAGCMVQCADAGH